MDCGLRVQGVPRGCIVGSIGNNVPVFLSDPHLGPSWGGVQQLGVASQALS